MRRLHLTLSAEEQQTLREAVRKHPLPYVRERAGALLKIADGQYAQDVATSGLLQKRCKQTGCGWVHRYNNWGIAGLVNKTGRGRNRNFSPSGGGKS